MVVGCRGVNAGRAKRPALSAADPSPLSPPRLESTSRSVSVVEAEALAVHFQDMDMMGETVEQRPGEALRAERFGPFVEGKDSR